MSKLTSSPHFISLLQMPTFDAGTPVLKVTQELARRNRGGFVIDEGERKVFIKGAALLEGLIRGPRISLREMTTQTDMTIGRLCSMSEVQDAVIPVEEQPVGSNADAFSLQKITVDKVYVVRDDSGLIGYFLNHETVVDPATKRIVYICGNGHRNADPDHGSCYTCAAKIVGTAQE